MTNDHYVLDGDGNPVNEPDFLKWATWHATANRHVGKDTIGDIQVSTVFLGLDHSFGHNQQPVLWETMIFGGEHDQYQERYTSRADAQDGHAKAVALVKESKS